MARPVSRLELTASERQELERRVKAPSASQRDSLRAAIILRRAQGIKQVQVAAELGVSVACVNKWSQCFDREGLAGLADAKGRGRPASLPADKVEQVLTAVTQPPKPRTRWSVRSMVQAAGMSPDSVHRIWKANDLKPHLTKTFKVSTDPHFEEKFWDVIGLYLDPPERALVLCCDEKSQCQALERTQPGCHWGSETSAPRPTITSATARSPCSPLSTTSTASSSRAWRRIIPTSNGCAFSSRSTGRRPRSCRCT